MKKKFYPKCTEYLQIVKFGISKEMKNLINDVESWNFKFYHDSSITHAFLFKNQYFIIFLDRLNIYERDQLKVLKTRSSLKNIKDSKFRAIECQMLNHF